MKNKTALALLILIVLMPFAQAQAIGGPEDATPPDITAIQLMHGPTTLFTWTTNEPANTKVEYGTTTAMNQTETKPDYETAHATTLQTTPGTTYYYRITNCDQGNNCRSTTIDNFIAGPFYVKADIPRYARSRIIDIPGTTRPGAEVTILVNNAEVRKAVIDQGTFLFRNIDIRQENNTITLKAKLGTETAEANYQTDVDNQPPLINATLPAVVTTATAQATIKVSEPVELTITYGNLTKNTTATATSTITIDGLTAGENIITFTAKDKAGYTSIAEERVLYDTGPPEFISHNLNQISPSYRQTVDATGKLSEPGSITVFVNGKPQKTQPTNPDGTFAITFQLERTTNFTTQQITSLDTGLGWKNKIRLEAVDAAGQKKSTEEVEAIYTVCGQGTWIDVHLTDPLPDRLNPRLLIEGIQQVGVAFNYTYRGGYKAIIDPRAIKIKPLQLAPQYQNEYDNTLIIANAPTKPQRGKTPTGIGYIQVNFNPITDPWAMEGETAPSNATMYDKEAKISDHRKNHCLIPEFGCMKLALELEIPFTEEIPITGLPQTTGGVDKKIENRIQRTCVNIEVIIDKRIPPDALPEGFLKATSTGLGKIVENIDIVLKPVQTVGQYVMYTCVAGQYLSLLPLFLEKYNCQYKKFETAVSGEGAFSEEIAQIGACEAQYGTESESATNCMACQKAKERRKWYDKTLRQVCDRVMCPAAPSLQYYLKTTGQQKPTQVKDLTPSAKEKLSAYNTDAGDIYAGSDCAAWVQKNPVQTTDEKKKRTPPKLFFTSKEVQDIYQDWLKHKSDTAGEGEGVNCAGMHPATPECCGKEYMDEWSSACGVSALGSGLDTFNEIKESACLSAQSTGKNELTGIEGETIQCNKLLNSLGGFCTKAGGPPLTTIKVAPVEPNEAENLGMSKYGEDNYLYIVVQEQMSGAGSIPIIQIGQSRGHTVKLGMVVKTLEFEQSGERIQAERSKINEKLEIKEHPDNYGFQQAYFTPDLMDEFRQKGTNTKLLAFKEKLCEAAGYSATCAQVNEKALYQQTIDAIGSPDQEYIIRPNDGLINSIRCICFPTFIAYLKLWRNIMQAVKSCIDIILITGDGEAGVCEAVISQYACDLLYEVLTCFTQSFSTGGARTGISGAGDLMGALVAAGTEMSRTAEGRYGDSAAYQTVFVEKKLVHSICMWAFTGTWDFDVSTAFDQSVEEIPIDSYALMTPCNRRFIAFNPATSPSGLTTWTYHFGIGFAAGAESDIELHLKCSGGYKCREIDGFERGKCDCETERDIIITPQGLPTKVKKNEILSQEVFHTMQGAGPSQIRYDKAYLVYRFKDGSTTREEKTDECTITQSGGAGATPAFCRYDPMSLSFRCQFGDATSGIRFKEARPTYAHTLQQKQVFAVGDKLNISVDITQDHQGGEKHNKYLEYAILGPAGQMITNNTDRGLTPLTTNGDYTKILSDITIDENWFGTAPTPTGINIIYSQWWSKLPDTKSPVNTMIQNIEFKRGITEITERNRFLVEIYKAQQNTYQIYRAGDPTISTTGFSGITEITGCGGTVQGNIINCNIDDRTLKITLKPDFLTNLKDVGEKYQEHIDYNPPLTTTNMCAPDKKLTPTPFKIKLTAYDADQYGQPTDQISIDPLTGSEATIEISFDVICANKNAPELTGITPPPPPMAPTELYTKIKDLIGRMQTTETAHKNKLVTYMTDTNINLALTAEQIKTDLNKIITDEDGFAKELEPLAKNAENLPQTGDAQTLTYRLKDLHNMLRMPTQAELMSPTPVIKEINIIYATKNALDNITKQTAPGTTPKSEDIRKVLQELLPFLEDAITVKNAIPSLIQKVTGTGTGPCPAGEEQGDYYQCSATTLTSPWIEETTRPCLTTTLQKCFKLPSTSYCSGTKQEFKYECQTEACSTGWENGELTCPTGICCKQHYTGPAVGSLEKIWAIKTLIETMQTQEDNAITQLEQRRHPASATETLKEMNPQGLQAPLIVLLTGIIGEETGHKKALQDLIGRYTKEQVDLPLSVNKLNEDGLPNVISELGKIKQELLTLAYPTATEIRTGIDKAKNIISSLQPKKREAINSLNNKLEIKFCPVGYDRYGAATSCFNICPTGWTPVAGDCENENFCCQAVPTLLANNVPMSPTTKFTRGEDVNFRFSIPLIQQGDIIEKQISFAGNNLMTFSENFEDSMLKIDFNQKITIQSVTDLFQLQYTLNDKTKITKNAWFNLDCKTGERDIGTYTCRPTCEPDELPFSRACDSGKCCRRSPLVLKIKPEKRKPVLEYIDMMNFSKSDKDAQKRILFCAYLNNTINAFNYGTDILPLVGEASKSYVLWPNEASVFGAEQYISGDFEPKPGALYPNQLDTPYYWVEDIFYSENDAKWYIKYYIDKDNTKTEDLETYLSDPIKEKNNVKQKVYFNNFNSDNFGNGRFTIDIWARINDGNIDNYVDLCSIKINMFRFVTDCDNDYMTTGCPKESVNDNEKVAGPAWRDHIKEDWGPWRTYAKDYDGESFVSALNPSKADRVEKIEGGVR